LGCEYLWSKDKKRYIKLIDQRVETTTFQVSIKKVCLHPNLQFGMSKIWDRIRKSLFNFHFSVTNLYKCYYSVRRLIGSRIIESSAYCNQIFLVPLYLNSTQNTSVNWISWLLLSFLCWPKVILLSGGHCSLKKEFTKDINCWKLRYTWPAISEISSWKVANGNIHSPHWWREKINL
jgi:hypothetical protein